MENHPIPQDVTGFKFKLIGSVTVKQFLYLLGFGILATIAFVLPISPFIKYPAMVFFALIGLGLAFVPIEGRPMDIMLANFVKAIPSENRYIYRKRGASLASYYIFSVTPKKQAPSGNLALAKAQSPHDEKKAILLSRLRSSSLRPDEEEIKRLSKVNSFFEEKAGAAIVSPVANPAPPAPPPPPQVQPANLAPAGGFPTLPDVPNVVLGIIRDPRGKALSNILVEIVDSSGIPVRAFKTNALGQFASATPLKDGGYKVYFEDPSKAHEFEMAEINLNGQIFTPLEVKSVDAREKLRRELFGGAAVAAT
jgi:hypothetical protein